MRSHRALAVALGVFYLACAAFNASVTLLEARATFKLFGEIAWLWPG